MRPHVRWSLVLVFCALASRARGEGPGIVPGVVGEGVSLGEERSAVLQREGKPDFASRRRGLQRDMWVKSRRVVWYRNGRVVQVSVTQARLKTPEGLSTASSFQEVVTVHTPLARQVYTARGYSGGGALCYYDDRKRGIAFEFAQNLDPDTALVVPFRLFAIHVHEPGKDVLPDFDEVPAYAALIAKCPDGGTI